MTSSNFYKSPLCYQEHKCTIFTYGNCGINTARETLSVALFTCFDNTYEVLRCLYLTLIKQIHSRLSISLKRARECLQPCSYSSSTDRVQTARGNRLKKKMLTLHLTPFSHYGLHPYSLRSTRMYKDSVLKFFY